MLPAMEEEEEMGVAAAGASSSGGGVAGGGGGGGSGGGGGGGGGDEAEKKKPVEGEGKSKRKMKTASQLEILEKTYAGTDANQFVLRFCVALFSDSCRLFACA